MVKNPPAGDSSSILGWEGPLEKEMATDSCIVDWRVSRTEESGRLQVMGSHRVGHDWANAHIGSLAQPAAWCRQMLPEHGLKSCPGFQVRNCPGTLSTYARGYLSISRVIQTPSLHGRYCCISHSEEKARTPESERVSCPVVSSVWLFTTPWTAAHQAPLSTGFPRQEYWSGLPFPSPGDLPHPGIEPRTPALRTDSLLSEPQGLEPIRTQEKMLFKAHTSASLWTFLGTRKHTEGPLQSDAQLIHTVMNTALTLSILSLNRWKTTTTDPTHTFPLSCFLKTVPISDHCIYILLGMPQVTLTWFSLHKSGLKISQPPINS